LTDRIEYIEPKWYVVHTYSGYENKVKANLEKIVENRGLHEYIVDIAVPMEEHIEIKEGKKKTILKKVFPGYVLVKMILTDETWYVIRNTRGVTGFVGPSSKPVPLSDEEVISMRLENIETVMDLAPGDNIRVSSGPLESFVGIIQGISDDKQKVKVMISMFGRETPVELEITQVQKI